MPPEERILKFFGIFIRILVVLETNSGGKITIYGGIRLILVEIDEFWWKDVVA